MKDCIFCKIINGEIPSYKIYEDEECLVFLDINPINPGHALIIPKKHYKTIIDAPVKLVEHLMGVVKKISESVKNELEPFGINILQNNGVKAGQEIPHMHIHVIPRFEGDRRHYRVKWKPRKLDKKQMKNLQERLRK